MAVKRWVLLASMVFATGASTAMAVEEPAFKQVLREGDFELRDYPALVAAEVTVTGDQKEAANKGFRLLAGYIFGGNRRRQSIAMTAPETLPVPDDSRVILRNVQPARFAVLRFSGRAQPGEVRTRSSELLALLKSHRLRAIGSVSLAQYNPPWTLWFMRRNEVMVEVEP